MTNLARAKQWASRLLSSQEGIVFVLAVLALLVFSVALPAFATPGNLLTLVRSYRFSAFSR